MAEEEKARKRREAEKFINLIQYYHYAAVFEATINYTFRETLKYLLQHYKAYQKMKADQANSDREVWSEVASGSVCWNGLRREEKREETII